MTSFLDIGKFKVVFALPNLVLEQTVETRYLAIIPSTDDRFLKRAASNGAVKALGEGFKDSKGRKREICFIVADQKAPASAIELEAIVGFRNSYAMACVLFGADAKIGNPNTLFTTFSDYFDFYPLCPTSDGKLLRQLGAAANSVDQPAGFCGQIDPELPKMGNTLRARPDNGLWEQLVARWTKRFVKGRKDWAINKLFRSLAIAYHASSVPRKNSLWFHDFGVNVAHWISAFEILVHPKNGAANLETVVRLLNDASFSESPLRRKRSIRFRGQKLQTNYAGVLYKQIYDARNDFLHGNPVTYKKLLYKTPESEFVINQIAPLIYGVALSTFLYEPPKAPLPKNVPIEKVIRRLRKTGLLWNSFEDALHRIFTGKSDFDL